MINLIRAFAGHALMNAATRVMPGYLLCAYTEAFAKVRDEFAPKPDPFEGTVEMKFGKTRLNLTQDGKVRAVAVLERDGYLGGVRHLGFAIRERRNG